MGETMLGFLRRAPRALFGLLLVVMVLGLPGASGCTVRVERDDDDTSSGARSSKPRDENPDDSSHDTEGGSAGAPGENDPPPQNTGGTSAGGEPDPDSEQAGTSSGGSVGSGLPGAKANTWTYLVYMLADNDLEPFALDDLNELMSVGSGENLTILVQVDRTDGEDRSSIGGLPNFTTTKRVRVDQNRLTELEDLGELDMGTRSAFENFLEWGIQAAPAEHYALVLWDHGAAWSQFGADFSHDYNGITLPELTSALDGAIQKTGLEGPLDLIGFDACLMGTWEVAAALVGRAQYLLASEELEPGHGWDHGVIDVLEAGTDPEGLGRALLAGYEVQAMSKKTLPRVTLALSKLSELHGVSEALDALTHALEGDGVGAHAAAVGRSRARVPTFGAAPSGESSEMTDLLLFASELATLDPAVEAEASALSEALDRAIVAQVRGATYADLGGLSFYFPARKTDYSKDYDRLAGVEPWRDYLKAFYGSASDLEGGPEFSNSAKTVYGEYTQDGQIFVSGDLVPGSYDNLAEATFGFGIVINDRGQDFIALLGERPADVSSGGQVSTTWDGTALQLTQGDRQAVAYYQLANESGGLLSLTIPFVVTENGASQTVFLVIVFAEDGSVVTQTFYEVVNGAFAEHGLDPNAVLQTTIPLVPVGGSEITWTTQSAEFDLDAELAFVQFADGSAPVYVSLSAYDYAGQSDMVDGLL